MERGPGAPERGGAERPRLVLAAPPCAARDARALGLTAAGFEVVCAGRGEEALARCRAARPALVVCEPWLEDMEGAALRRRLAEQPGLRSTPFLLAGKPEGPEAEDAALRELVARIRILLDEEAEPDPDPEVELEPATAAAARPVGPPPAPDRVFRVDYQVLASRLAELPDAVNGLLRRVDGRRTVEQVLRGVSLPQVEALAVLTRLVEEGVLRPAPPVVRGQPPRVVRFSPASRRPGAGPSHRSPVAPTPRPEPVAAPAAPEPEVVEVGPRRAAPSPARPPEPARPQPSPATLRWVPIVALLLLLALLGLWRARSGPGTAGAPGPSTPAPEHPARR